LTRAALFLLVLPIVAPAQTSSLGSWHAFQKATVVLRHARCMNCHIPGDSPLNGASGDVHAMRVKRGADGQGTPVMRCATCHQETNGELPHSPPGSREWKLPPPQTKMAWVGLNDRQLCRALLDSKINGGMTREKIVNHMNADPRVLWAWAPGPGRDAPPLGHREFVELIGIWIERGASCAP
jgi:hypothetical protein